MRKERKYEGSSTVELWEGLYPESSVTKEGKQQRPTSTTNFSFSILRAVNSIATISVIISMSILNTFTSYTSWAERFNSSHDLCTKMKIPRSFSLTWPSWVQYFIDTSFSEIRWQRCLWLQENQDLIRNWQRMLQCRTRQNQVHKVAREQSL